VATRVSLSAKSAASIQQGLSRGQSTPYCPLRHFPAGAWPPTAQRRDAGPERRDEFESGGGCSAGQRSEKAGAARVRPARNCGTRVLARPGRGRLVKSPGDSAQTPAPGARATKGVGPAHVGIGPPAAKGDRGVVHQGVAAPAHRAGPRRRPRPARNCGTRMLARPGPRGCEVARRFGSLHHEPATQGGAGGAAARIHALSPRFTSARPAAGGTKGGNDKTGSARRPAVAPGSDRGSRRRRPRPARNPATRMLALSAPMEAGEVARRFGSMPAPGAHHQKRRGGRCHRAAGRSRPAVAVPPPTAPRGGTRQDGAGVAAGSGAG